MQPTALNEASDPNRRRVGFVGGGQLARMAGEAASALGLTMAVLAEHRDDAACGVATEVIVGSPWVAEELDALVQRCEVVTFDHEQVDLALVDKVVADGAIVRPGVGTLEVAVNKAHMRHVLGAAGVAMPAHTVIPLAPGRSDPGSEVPTDGIASFATDHGWPVVLKAVRGGYDGKGVWFANNADEAASVIAHLSDAVLVEEAVALKAELAVMVARRPSGEMVAWPAVETAEVDGVCREVLVPGRLPDAVMDAASQLAEHVAEVVGTVGVLAVDALLVRGPLLGGQRDRRPARNWGTGPSRGRDLAIRKPPARRVGFPARGGRSPDIPTSPA